MCTERLRCPLLPPGPQLHLTLSQALSHPSPPGACVSWKSSLLDGDGRGKEAQPRAAMRPCRSRREGAMASARLSGLPAVGCDRQSRLTPHNDKRTGAPVESRHRFGAKQKRRQRASRCAPAASAVRCCVPSTVLPQFGPRAVNSLSLPLTSPFGAGPRPLLSHSFSDSYTVLHYAD